MFWSVVVFLFACFGASTCEPTNGLDSVGEWQIHMNCTERYATRDERWVTGRGDLFLKPETLKQHFNADWIIDKKSVCKYKIQWFAGGWSTWYYPGQNDNIDTKKNDDVWNNQHYTAGRRQWSMFADHHHVVCYCFSNTPEAVSANFKTQQSSPHSS